MTMWPYCIGKLESDGLARERILTDMVRNAIVERDAAYDEVEAYNSDLTRMIDRAEELFSALKSIQWGTESRCAACGMAKRRGHVPDCRIGYALREA